MPNPPTCLDGDHDPEASGRVNGKMAACPSGHEGDPAVPIHFEPLVQPEVCYVPVPVPDLPWAEVVSGEENHYLTNGGYVSGRAAPCPACGVLIRTRRQSARLKQYGRQGLGLGGLLLVLGIFQLVLSIGMLAVGAATMDALTIFVGATFVSLGVILGFGGIGACLRSARLGSHDLSASR